MKLKITLAFILLLSAFSCKKETGSDALTGKWRTTEILFTGNMSEGPLYIQFIWPGKVQSTFFSKCTGYSTSGDKLTLKNTGAAVSQLNYTYTIKHDT
ncbi:MAG: hypothetical protein JSU01_19055, partial [Bacteroidetes bacterium]|nr:hypothetical protein [Bacteroidota bacterium]